MTDTAKTIVRSLQDQIAQFAPDVSAQEVGTVLEAGDGIARAARPGPCAARRSWCSSATA